MEQKFTKAIDILYLAKQNGIDIILNDEQLQLKLPKNKDIDKSLIDEIRLNKQLILDFLKDHSTAENNYGEITKAPRDSTYRLPLSFSQERLWFIDRLEGSIQYHLPAVLRLTGNVNKAALEYAFRTIVNRHEVLRTVIREDDGKPWQFIKNKDELQLSIIDGSRYQENSLELKQNISSIVNEPFDLSRDDMLRITLINLHPEEHILVVTMHHIASDGWSTSILVKEFAELYRSYIEDREPSLESLPVQYADYAFWQKNYLKGELLEKKLAYWKRKLNGIAPLQLPTDHIRPPVQSRHGAMIGFSIQKDLSDQLLILSQQQGATLFMTLMASLNVMFQRYSGQEDICIGTPIAGRGHEQLEKLIGFFINTLVLRNEVETHISFTELLKQVKQTTLDAYEHQDVPFGKIVDAIVKERDMSRSPLFQVMLVFQNTPEIPELRLGEVQLSKEAHEHVTAQFDLSFIITETSTGLQGSVNYCTDLFTEPTIQRMVSHFKQLLSSIVSAPQKNVGSLSMLTKADEDLLLSFNNTKASYPENKNIVTLFEEQVNKTPHDIAIVFNKEQVTYTELNERSNRLANYLQSKGIRPGSLVPICVERAPEMIIGLMGILKAGAAYVPIDPAYPQDRIGFMIEDSRGTMVITNIKSRSMIPSGGNFEVIELDGEWSLDHKWSEGNLQPSIQSEDLAYVIYTSGSTGKPKGVMIEHGNVYSFICWCREEFSSSQFEIVYAATSICFDLSVFEIFYPLSIGKRIRLLENGLQISRFVSHDKNVLTNSVPAVIQSLLKEGADLSNISVLNMAGEPIPLQVLQRLNPDKIEIRNLYGPTEDTTYSTVYRIKKGSRPFIGKPISNTAIYIVNPEMELVPVGVAGEICISGAGLARGYLNRFDLTAEKFIANPFSKDLSKLYKTGDSGRWMPDGNVEYLGRLDNQVKIRGYRIELGEIETLLQQSGLVNEAVIVAREETEGNKRLVGYIIPKGKLNRDDISAFLKSRLPEFMIPSLWVELESFPLTPNGKINRKALPEPTDTHEFIPKEYIAPKNEVEAALVEIWKKLLNTERVSVNDNFFNLGGHSLLAVELMSAIRKEFGVEIPLIDIFNSTILSLYTLIDNQKKQASTPLVQTKRKNDISLTLNQASELAKRLETGLLDGQGHFWGPNGEGRYMIPINKDGTKIPFFGIISFKSYRLLGNFIQEDQPLYYLPPTQSTSVVDVATHYVKEIKLLQPTGPYCIGGFCAGGNIALEIAQQLESQGDQVSALVLFEYYSPLAILPKQSLKYKKRKLSYYKDRILSLRNSNTSGAGILKFFIKKSLDRFKVRFVKPLEKKFIVSPEFNKYILKPYSGKVKLFKASIPPIEVNDSPLMGWSEYFKGNVEVITVEGGHLGIFREPAVKKLAQKLSTVLEEVNIVTNDRP